MTLKLELTSEIEAGLLAQAKAEGLTLEQFLNRTLQSMAQASAPDTAQTPEAWTRSFHNWVQGHSTTTPLLSDEAVSRDSIYRDRGL